jgi:hypothetical protein
MNLLFSSIAFFEVASVRTKCGALMFNHMSTQIRMENRSSLSYSYSIPSSDQSVTPPHSNWVKKNQNMPV